MAFQKIIILVIISLLNLNFGCSANSAADPMGPEKNSQDLTPASTPMSWGTWDVSISTGGDISLTEKRAADFAINTAALPGTAKPGLQMDIINIQPGGGYTDVTLDVGIAHNTIASGIFTGFDVIGVVMGDGNAQHPSGLSIGGADDLQLINADGYTRWMNCTEFSGTNPAHQGYAPAEGGSTGFEPTAILNPYKYFCDGLTSEYDAYEYTVGHPAQRGLFSEGAVNTRRYILRFPAAAGFRFQYAIVARWAFNSNHPGPPQNIPDDFPLQANAPECVALSVNNDTSDLWSNGSTGGGSFKVILYVANWVAQPDSGVMNDYTIRLYSDAWGESIHDMSVYSQGDNYCTYVVDIPASPTYSGSLDVWISIGSTGLTYANPFGVHTAAENEPLTAYFRYTANVVYHTPSGEFWQPPVGHAPRFLFIHHSVGDGFLYAGGMWDKLVAAGFDVHDATYGDQWFGDNTDPNHFPETFTTYYDDMINWELAPGQYYDIVAFKSCFPASNIYDQAMLEDYYGYYNAVKAACQAHPETLFIPFSTPPLVPNDTEAANAARARTFANWLKGEYDEGEYNIAAYDVFNILAGSNSSSGDYNMLRYSYQGDPSDSHPNQMGSTAVADDFTAWVTALVWGG